MWCRILMFSIVITWIVPALGFFPNYPKFPVKISTQGCDPRYTKHCNGAYAKVNFTGGRFSHRFIADQYGIVYLPYEMHGWRMNVDLLNARNKQSVQRCYRNTYVWQKMTIRLRCYNPNF